MLIILIIVTASRTRASCQMFSYRLRSYSKGQRSAQFPPLLHTGELMDCGPATTCFIVGFLARRLDLHYFCPLHLLCFSAIFIFFYRQVIWQPFLFVWLWDSCSSIDGGGIQSETGFKCNPWAIKKTLWPSAPCIHPSVPGRSISSHNLAFPISGYWFKCILPAYTVSGCWWRSRPRGRLSTCIFMSVAATSVCLPLQIEAWKTADYIHNMLA